MQKIGICDNCHVSHSLSHRLGQSMRFQWISKRFCDLCLTSRLSALLQFVGHSLPSCTCLPGGTKWTQGGKRGLNINLFETLSVCKDAEVEDIDNLK